MNSLVLEDFVNENVAEARVKIREEVLGPEVGVVGIGDAIAIDIHVVRIPFCGGICELEVVGLPIKVGVRGILEDAEELLQGFAPIIEKIDGLGWHLISGKSVIAPTLHGGFEPAKIVQKSVEGLLLSGGMLQGDECRVLCCRGNSAKEAKLRVSSHILADAGHDISKDSSSVAEIE